MEDKKPAKKTTVTKTKTVVSATAKKTVAKVAAPTTGKMVPPKKTKDSLVLKKGITVKKPKIAAPDPAPVKPRNSTEGKLTKAELKKFRHDLLVLREKVYKGVDTAQKNAKHHNEAETEKDNGTSLFDKFLAYERVGNTKDILARIDEAIARIDKGTYGTCLICGGAIRRVRLEVQPFSKHCIKCQEDLEKMTKR